MVWNRMDRMAFDGLGNPSETRGYESTISIASRRAGYDRLRSGILGSQQSALLLTGEGGAGKTWLWNRVARSLPAGWLGLSVDMTTGLGASEFLLLIGERLGLEAPRSVASARIQIASALRDEATDGRSWILIVEDAHAATPDVWEEIRVLSNHLGEVGGFACLLVVAQTELVRRLSGRGLASIAGKFSDHVHLPPLDLDECRALVDESSLEPQPRAHGKSLEEIHRDARGNSREILRLVRRSANPLHRTGRGVTKPVDLPSMPAGEIAPSPRRKRRIDNPIPFASPTETSTPGGEATPKVELDSSSRPKVVLPEVALVPSRPPLRLEEGLIEVGWSGEEPVTSPPVSQHLSTSMTPDSGGMTIELQEAAPTSFDDSADLDPDLEGALQGEDSSAPAEEWIEDPYAALQAWSEWARNREIVAETKGEVADSSTGRSKATSTLSTPESEKSEEHDPTIGGAGSIIRAEGEHEHAPYGHLFGETRRSKQS